MKKFLSLILAFAMVFSILAGSVSTALAAVTGTSADKAMHFFIRHWHTVDENGSANVGDNYGTYAFPVEGWIVPNGNGYSFYADEDLTTALELSAYIVDLDKKTGTVTLTVNPRTIDGELAETFVGFSMSAGQGAADTTAETLVIQYREDIALVKGHVFYQEVPERVMGSSQTSVFKWVDEIAENQERDTAKIYVDASGEILFKSDGTPYYEGDTPSEPGARLVKVYSTLKGLHTDKTASANENYNKIFGDERTFNIDLEAWYSVGQEIFVGLVLDASGSMAFAMENLNPMEVDSNTQAALSITKLDVNNPPQSASDWEKLFLNEEQVNALLNKHKTDNSMLSYSGYSYYVFDPRDDDSTTTMEFVPLGYWGGQTEFPYDDALIADYPLNKGTSTATPPLKDDRDWLLNTVNGKRDILIERIGMNSSGESFTEHEITNWSLEPIKMDASNGFALRATEELGTNSLGFKILSPETKTFTLSFSIKKTNNYTDVEGNNSQNRAEILYIGPDTIPDDNSFLRVIRDGKTINADGSASNSTNRLKGILGWDVKQSININNVFNKLDEKQYITMVFTDNGDGTVHVKTYLNGEQQYRGNTGYTYESDIPLTTNDDGSVSIVFNGIRDNANPYNGAELYIDDIQLYDTALPAGAVETLYRLTTAGSNLGLDDGVSLVYSDYGQILGVINRDDYFVNGKGQAGWYYINSSSKVDKDYLNPVVQTAKMLYGFSANNNNAIPNQILNPSYLASDRLDTTGGIGADYKPTANGPTRFFVDQNNLLRCFSSSGTTQTDDSAEKVQKQLFVSYVYENSDEDYVKAEALQRALGAFAVTLNTLSPASEISAVRFSTQNIQKGDYDQLSNLVLLDWTNDPSESVGILALQRGIGGTVDGDPSASGLMQYNYGLTGGTYTKTGLAAFEEYLAKQKKDSKATKYLIVFTDGKDNDYSGGTSHDAIRLADTLKKDYGYTIYTVMLNAGSISDEVNPDAYKLAKDFLTYMSGDKQSSEIANMSPTAQTEYWKQYSSATNPEQDEADDGGYTSTAIETLMNIFTRKIAPSISNNLTNYTVKDTIDPRFDLIDVDGHVWHLDRGGVVTVTDTKSTTPLANHDLSTGGTVAITINHDTDVDARSHTPELGYDSENHVYYLEWTGQTIPGSELDAEELSIWNARFTIRAKDDFIGGNGVLTNGQDKKMNYVFSPQDKAPSSGTDKATIVFDADTDAYPSKGFPRTVVNVQLPAPEGVRDELIYLGEALDPIEIINQMIQKAIEDEDQEDPRSKWYWEYLLRYGQEKHGDKYWAIRELLAAEDGVLTMEYAYLPSTVDSVKNETGLDVHRADVLGTMTYTWTNSNPPTEAGTVTDKTERTFKLGVTYVPYGLENPDGESQDTPEGLDLEEEEEPEEEPGENPDEEPEEEPIEGPKYRFDLLNKNGLIQEKNEDDELIYSWQPDYKPAVGKSVQESKEYVYTIRVIAGEISLQLLVPQSSMSYLKSHDVTEITYTATLKRSYDGGETPIENETVGTYTLTGKVLDGNATGDSLVTLSSKNAAFDFAEGYADYAPTYGLPIGTYTLVPDVTDTELYSFSPITVVTPLEARYFDLYPFQYQESGSGAKTLASLIAGGDVSPMLGTENIAGRKYTDERYALLRVTVNTQQGSLKVSKTVSGKAGEKNRDFHFTVTLSDKNLNGTFGDMTFVNGVASFTLKHGESKTARGLTSNTTYSVSELEANQDGYATTSSGDAGVIKDGEESNAIFINNRDKETVPQTGDNSHLGLWIALLLVSGMAIAFILLNGKKRFGHR